MDSQIKKYNDKIEKQNRKIEMLVAQIKECNKAYKNQVKYNDALKKSVDKKKKAESLRTIVLLKETINKNIMKRK